MTISITSRNMDALRHSLDEAAENMDNVTHDVQSWVDFLSSLLEDLELLAMANDPNHPGEYERMIKRLSDEIAVRLKEGRWRTVEPKIG
jgi:hypothetical protein